MTRMTLDQMRIFLAVAKYLHFTQAADALYMTQSSVSAAIGNIESYYNIKLFNRIGRRIEITEAGRLLQKEAENILTQVSLTERGLQELNNLQRGELRVGASINIGNYWLPEKICLFKQKYSEITIKCTLGNAEEICQGTESGKFDLGLVTTEMESLPLKNSLSQEIIDTYHLEIVVGQGHPWFGREHICLNELLTTDWIMREAGSGTQEIFEKALIEWGINLSKLKIFLVLNSSEMVKTVVEKGIGAASMPDLMVAKEINFATLHRIRILNPKDSSNIYLEIVQPIWKLKHKQRFQTKLSIAFEQILGAVILPNTQ